MQDSLHHDEVLVVGPAIITAHEYESKVAKYPRILVIRSLREKMERDEKLKRLLWKSADGLRYLHVLHEFEKSSGMCLTSASRRQSRKPHFGLRWGRGKRSTAHCRKRPTGPEHFEKIRWFADYFNTSVLKRLYRAIKDLGQAARNRRVLLAGTSGRP